MSLNKRQGLSFLVFLLNIISYASLVKSGLNMIFHSKAQLLFTVRLLGKIATLDWMLLTTEKRDVSSTKKLQFDKFLMQIKINNGPKI